MTKQKHSILTIESDKIPEAPHKGVIVTNGLAIEAMISIIFSITAISAAFVMWQFMSDVYSSYFLMLTTLVYGQLCLIVRRLRIPAILQIPAHLILLGGYLAIYYFSGDINSFLKNILPISLLLVVNTIYSFYKLFKSNSTVIKYDSLVFPLFLEIAISVLISLADDETPQKILSFVLINVLVTVVMFFVARQLYVFEESYYHSIRSSSVPMKQIRKQNYKTVCGLVIVAFVGFAFAYVTMFFLPVDSIIRYLFAGLAYLIKGFFALFIKEDTGEAAISNRENEMQDIGEESTSLFSQIAYYCLVVLFIAAAVFALYLLIRYVVLKVLSHHREEKKETIDSEYVTDIIENIDVKTTQTRKKRDFGQGYEKTIRKAFYSKVKHAIHKGVLIDSSDSPQEISRKIEEKTGTSIADLTEKYEEVRY